MLTIHTAPAFFAEKTYVCSFLFEELLGIPVSLHAQAGAKHCRLSLPNGKSIVIEDHFFGQAVENEYLIPENVPAAPLQLPHPFEPGETITGIYGRPHFARDGQGMTLGLDVLASAFFMLTRWEEYARADRDRYGRFPAEAALAFRADFLHRPVVQEYAACLRQMLLHLGYPVPARPRPFQLHLSHDVDHPYLWGSAAARLRTVAGSLLRRAAPGEAAYWLRRHFFSRRDPYDIFDAWMDFSEKNGLRSHFNFLGERPPSFDCHYRLDHPFVKNLLRKIAARGHVTGFHPSREAFADEAVFQRELDSLRRAAQAPVRTGRQHYLCFAAPHTWQRWADAGFDWDSSLGYPEAEGFRCGTACEFPVFNFLTRKVLPLREKPLLAMDVTLAQYRRYTPEQGFERLSELRRQVQRHGGEFVLLWHNSSWNTPSWAPWQRVYREFVETC